LGDNLCQSFADILKAFGGTGATEQLSDATYPKTRNEPKLNLINPLAALRLRVKVKP
jgi:hypothetical protein